MDRNNKRWFKSWMGPFARGSSERAALSEITTGTNTRPALSVRGVILAVQTLPEPRVRRAYGAARAETFTVQHKGPNAPAFTVLVQGLAAKTFEHTATDAGEHAYKVKGHNGAGAGAESVALKVNVAQQAAA